MMSSPTTDDIAGLLEMAPRGCEYALLQGTPKSVGEATGEIYTRVSEILCVPWVHRATRKLHVLYYRLSHRDADTGQAVYLYQDMAAAGAKPPVLTSRRKGAAKNPGSFKGRMGGHELS